MAQSVTCRAISQMQWRRSSISVASPASHRIQVLLNSSFILIEVVDEGQGAKSNEGGQCSVNPFVLCYLEILFGEGSEK